MKLFEQIERLNLMHKLIDEQRTGTPDYFAKQLSLSKRQLFNIIDDLKIMGAPICYDSAIESYRYKREYFLNIDINMKYLSEEDLSDINGGNLISECNFTSPDPNIFAV